MLDPLSDASHVARELQELVAAFLVVGPLLVVAPLLVGIGQKVGQGLGLVVDGVLQLVELRLVALQYQHLLVLLLLQVLLGVVQLVEFVVLVLPEGGAAQSDAD